MKIEDAKPILFNTEMVRAILDGRKDTTRRIVKREKIEELKSSPFIKKHADLLEGMITLGARYYEGQVLYVRETWNYGYIEHSDAYMSNETWFEEASETDVDYIRAISSYFYKADGEKLDDVGMIWRPSIHMPKSAARIFLRVTHVHAERLQDITAEECVHEGIPEESMTDVGDDFTIGQFADLWDSTVKKDEMQLYGYDANPWVLVYEFERIEGEKDNG